MHFGFPFVHSDDIIDPQFGEGKKPGDYTPPVQKLGPHVAALGMKFYTGDMFPAEYKNQVFIAEHGSWNRSKKIGYRITLVKLEGDKAVSYTPFAEGWLNGDNVKGRPVDIAVMKDGSMLVSDDYAGVIYRITYKK
jgi:glucose/arabinose dehydrogenase